MQQHVHSLAGEPRPKVIHVDVPQPVMGGKAWLLHDCGLFVLERGPGTLVTLACTHAGAGAIEVIDGVPDDNGYFAADDMEPPYDPPDPATIELWGKRNGRVFYRANPVVMGSWMLNAGFHNGLTIRAPGGHNALSAVATVVWMPFRVRT